MKAIEIGQTFDSASITSTGLVFHLRRHRTGRYFVSAIYHTRWHAPYGQWRRVTRGYVIK